MDKGRYLRMVKTIVFIVGFTLFQIVLVWKLRVSGGSQWAHITDIVLGLISWLVLWQLSCASYKNGKGIGRWVRLSGLFKALFIWCISLGLCTWALWTYFNLTVMRPMQQMGAISCAIVFFYEENKTYPGASGEISSDVYSELKGSPDAKINVKHVDYLEEAHVETVTDRWGHPYRFRIDPTDPNFPNLPNIVIISCGPNGVFENGKGDGISDPPSLAH